MEAHHESLVREDRAERDWRRRGDTAGGDTAVGVDANTIKMMMMASQCSALWSHTITPYSQEVHPAHAQSRPTHMKVYPAHA